MTRHRPEDRGGVCLHGAPLDTGNLGVSALGLSTIAAVAARLPDVPLTVFDNGRGHRRSRVDLGAASIDVEHRGAWISRRLHRQESLWTMAAASHLPVATLPNLRTMDRARVVLDASGGDSFTDLYGPRRLRLITLPKRVVLRRGRPLVLLPQTYGPFRDPANARDAGDIIARAAQAWARDADSFERLRELVGDRFDPERHRVGVDVAFALPAVDPEDRLGGLRSWLEDPRPPVGVNISGLLGDDAAHRFGLRADYPDAMERLVRRFLDRTDRRVLLVAHTRGAAAESDDRAAERLATTLDRPERVRTLPSGLDAHHLKWVIGRLCWFSGARMHATIAALSSGVPVCGIAYSDKMRGVFATCGVAGEIADAREITTDGLTDAVWSSWERRDQVRDVLTRTAPDVVERAQQQFDHILVPAHDPAP